MGDGHPALVDPQLSVFLSPTWGCEAVHNAINTPLMTSCRATNVGRKVTVLRTPGSQTCRTSETEQGGQGGKDGIMQAHSQVKARLQQCKFHQLCPTRGAEEKRNIPTWRKMGIGSLGLGTTTNKQKGKRQEDHKISVIKIRGVRVRGEWPRPGLGY